MRILVVEDERKIARLIQRALEQESYAVDVALNGDEGHAMATTEPYDALIIDRMLPGLYNGTEIIADMRKSDIHTPALLLTALGRTEDKVEGLDSGADDYLVKPFEIEELLARVRALIRRPHQQQSTVLQVGDLSLDAAKYRVTKNGDEIALTQKEYGLLEFLMRHPGQILSKDRITAHVWDYDADILPNTVEVYIKYLRNKIDKPYRSDTIKTIRGFGYKLVDG